MVIYINTADCNGCGGCVEICPEIFEMDEHGELAVIIKQPESEDESRVDEAIALCPGDAIEKE